MDILLTLLDIFWVFMGFVGVWLLVKGLIALRKKMKDAKGTEKDI